MVNNRGNSPGYTNDFNARRYPQESENPPLTSGFQRLPALFQGQPFLLRRGQGGARRIELTAKRLKARGISSIEAGIGEPRLQGGRLPGPPADQGLPPVNPPLFL